MIKFKKLRPDAIIPSIASPGDAGFDLHAIDSGCVAMNSVSFINTGIVAAIPNGYVGIIKPRSGLAANWGLDVLGGVIDSSYRGEIKIMLTSNSGGYGYNAGERVAQLVVVPYLCSAQEVFDLDDTERGADGFGSTGI